MKNTKNVWEKPALKVHGDVERLTQRKPAVPRDRNSGTVVARLTS